MPDPTSPSDVLVRPATWDDLPAVKAIYDVHVHHGIATFDVEAPPLEYWQARLDSTEPGDHFLVADDGGAAVGFSYSSAYRPRSGYRHTRETSVYVSDAALGRGAGRRLYDALLAAVRADGMRTALAVVALPNDASQALHRACGFTRVGVMHAVGWKLGRWIDTEWWELPLSQEPPAR